MNSIVITTIQATTPSVAGMVRKAVEHGWDVVLVGDRRTPSCAWPSPIRFISIDEQQRSPHSLAALLPENHYARKNLGYLHAMAQGAGCIYDTDDDNAPLNTWRPRASHVEARRCDTQGWVNAYSWFTDAHIWPRGLPLAHVRDGQRELAAVSQSMFAPVQQGLANGSPDVDAIWRLVLDRPIEFRAAGSIGLAPGTWSPFNSQSTWWFPEAWPLMYLPSFVSFRMTDIWRSFVAQRCLWAMGCGVVFHDAEVFQERNEHNLLRDFEQEVPGYLGNERMRTVLEDLDLAPGIAAAGNNLRRCYEALVREGFVPTREMELVTAWLADVRDAGAKP